MFLKLHNKDGVFIDEKSSRIAAEVRARADEMSQPLPGTAEACEVDMTMFYLEVVGGVSKKEACIRR